MAIDTEILLGKLIPPTKLQRASTKCENLKAFKPNQGKGVHTAFGHI
jgi:hypothetical protein